jgi:hypothetical protein
MFFGGSMKQKTSVIALMDKEIFDISFTYKEFNVVA